MDTENWKVTKRNNKVVKYDKEKIINAVKQAMLEVGVNDTDKKSKLIANRVEEKMKKDYYDNNKIPTVNHIQDLVEYTLMESNFNKTAKAYILYRDKRKVNRIKDNKEYKRLTDDFISDYKHKPNPFPTELGEFIFYRTYSRWLEDEERRKISPKS